MYDKTHYNKKKKIKKKNKSTHITYWPVDFVLSGKVLLGERNLDLPSGAMSLILGSPHSPAAWPWVGHLNILNLSFTNYKMGLQDLSHLPANVARTFRWANECGWVLYTQKKK